MSIGQSIAPLSIERSAVDSSAKSEIQASAAILQSAQTVKDLKLAGLKGEHVTISDEQLVRAIERAVKAMQGASTQLQFSVHEKTKQIMVKVLNSDTGQVIREIPPEKNLDFVAKLWEMAGILVDERR
ncbi:flagellar biosynthesis protein FlaG [Paenibacillus contaminans]|uniref:Flagellar biosynthesis protein FlaG n=2 Tax=Paenibacillus contaminans TaxID=450362 RepID=A0A329MC27_9BACL|nr:flagellar biosynthesis protein FlaG [Paenibacillus contaminans]